MFKTRFLKWGIHKKLKLQDVTDAISQRVQYVAAGAAIDADSPRRRSHEKRLLAYIRRMPAYKRQQLEFHAHAQACSIHHMGHIPTISVRRPLPRPDISVLFSLKTPSELRGPEQCIHNLRAYIHGSFEQGLWKPADIAMRPGGRGICSWYNRIQLAVTFLKLGQASHAFRVLETCFSRFKGILLTLDPVRLLRNFLQDHLDVQP
jgi:hypothetical protein